MSATLSRDELLALSPEDLVRQCRVDTCRGTGPGGQKRNKTESAVRVTHVPSGISATDDTSRSQHLNRAQALRKLRLQLALQLRQVPASWSGVVPGLHSPAYARWVGVVFDTLAAHGFQVSPAAVFLGLSTSRLMHALGRDPVVWQALLQGRVASGLAPLRHD